MGISPALRCRRSAIGPSTAIYRRPMAAPSATAGRKVKTMSEPAGEPLGSVGQREVLVRVRRALGRTVSVRPAPLEPFVEPRAAEDVEALVTRFSTELNAVGGNVYRLMSGKLQFVGEVATGIADICHSPSVTKVALSGLSWLAEIALSDQLKARGLSVFMTAELGAS